MKKLILLLLLIFLSTNIFAQKDDKIKALKVSFFTEKLDLIEKEAEQFWPIYNAYYTKTSKIKRQDIRGIRKEVKENKETITNEKSKELLDKLSTAINSLHEEETKLIKKLEKVISHKKILLLKIAEDDFKRKILEQYRNKRKTENK